MATLRVESIGGLRARVRAAREEGKSIGCVPTMGALHAGHAALIDRARGDCGFVVATLFVNPMQFNERADLERYPRSLEADLAVCRRRGVDVLFIPAETEMYPRRATTFVDVEGLTDVLCGAFRPGHFRGVTTVVMKLLHIVVPDRAYFGEKDYQQLAVIRRMVEDLNLPVEIVSAATVREPDGLALSSRNRNLTAEQRAAALALPRALQAARRAVAAERTERRGAAQSGAAVVRPGAAAAARVFRNCRSRLAAAGRAHRRPGAHRRGRLGGQDPPDRQRCRGLRRCVRAACRRGPGAARGRMAGAGGRGGAQT